MSNHRRASSQLSDLSNAAALVLSPSMTQVENKTPVVRNSALSTSKRSGAADSQLRKNSTGAELKGLDTSANYGNLVQTKAQQQAQNPELAYIKRDTANDKIAKANAMKQRKSKNTASGTATTTMPVKSVHASGQATAREGATQTTPQQNFNKKVSQNNIDLAHMSVSLENRENQTASQPTEKAGQINATESQKYVSSQQSSGLPPQSHLPMKSQNLQPAQQVIASPDMLVQTLISSQKGKQTSQQYARFRLQEHIKALARPKNAPICAPRLRELSNVVFEQQVVNQFDSKQRTASIGSQDAVMQLPNDNFKGPHHMAAQFRSHKVGERQMSTIDDSTLVSPSQSQPFYDPSVIKPTSYRPQSHYGRVNQEQMLTSSIIMQQSMQNQSSTQLLFRNQSLRERQFKFSERNTLHQTMPASNSQALKGQQIKVEGDGQGMASLVIDEEPQIQKQFSTIQQPGPPCRKPPRNMSASSRQQYPPQHQPRRNQARAGMRTTQPRIKGNELRIQKNKMFDTSTTVSRHDRIEAHESLKLQRQYLATMQKMIKHQQGPPTQPEPPTINPSRNTAGSGNRSPLYQTKSARPSTRTPHDRNTQELSHGGKNVTVFDKLNTQTLDNTVEISQQQHLAQKKLSGTGSLQQNVNHVMTPSSKKMTLGLEQVVSGSRDQKLEESINYAGSQESMQKITDQVLSGELILSENQQISSDLKQQTKPSNSLVENFQNDKLQNFMNKMDSNKTHSSRVSPTNQNLSGEEKPNNSTVMHNYTTRQNMEQRLDDGYHLKNVADLKSFSSNEDQRLAPVEQNNLNSNIKSQASPSKQKSQTISIERIAAVNSAAQLLLQQTGRSGESGFAGPVMMSKSRLARMRQEARRAKVSLARRQAGNNFESSRALAHSKSCEKCTHKELEATRKQIDQGHMNANKSKVYFKPSVVEIQDESLTNQMSGRTDGYTSSPSRRTKDGQSKENLMQHQNYLLGPHVSQEYINLGSIREESHTNDRIMRSSIDSNAMQALFAQAEGGEATEFEVNPETREFILYLQQVQPDLIIQTAAAQFDDPALGGTLLSPGTALLPRTESVSPVKLRKGTMATASLSLIQQSFNDSNREPIVSSHERLVQKQETLNNVIVEENSIDLNNANGPSCHSPDGGVNTKHNGILSDQFASDRTHRMLHSLETLGQPNSGRDAQDLPSQEILGSEDENLYVPLISQPDQLNVQRDAADPYPSQIESIVQPGNNEGESLRMEENGENDGTFDDQPVNYTGQINMMQDIFKQIANQRANASRTTVRNQKVIFQPTLREFRRLDFKPITEDVKRYPPGSVDGMHPAPRPAEKVAQPGNPGQMYPWVTTRARSHRVKRGMQQQHHHHLSSNTARMHDEEGGNQALKLNRTQLGTQGQFASLLNRKRADKMVTWDVEPPSRTNNNSFRQQNSSYYSQMTSGNNSYYLDEQNQVPNQPIYTSEQQQQFMHHMSAIKEVPSISQHAGSFHEAASLIEVAKLDQSHKTSSRSNRTGQGQQQYIDIDGEVRQQMHDQFQERQNNSSRLQQHASQKSSSRNTNQNQSEQQQSAIGSKKSSSAVTQSTSHNKKKHREGRPVGNQPSIDSDEKKQDSQAAKGETSKTAQSQDLKDEERKTKQAAAKAKSKAHTAGTSSYAETLEWSQRPSKAAQKKDEYGQALTHKGNVIRRGFNTAQQRKTRIVATNDPAILDSDNLKHLFNEDKHKITNYISELGPPTKKTPELSKQQWKRIQKAQFDYDNMDDKHEQQVRENRKRMRSAKKKRRMEEAEQEATNASAMIEDKGNLFSFSNPDRYKTDQLKEQAMALLVPGYLQYVYDIN